jgi:hypothetical protein
MKAKGRARTDEVQRLRIGDRVLVRWPGTAMEAEVIADRGLILSGDRQVVRIRAVEETDLPNEFDVPAEYLEPMTEPPAA